MNWLPSMDLNHDKQIQSLLCYRYTTRQARRLAKLGNSMDKSSILRRSMELALLAAGLVSLAGCVRLNPQSRLELPASHALAAAHSEPAAAIPPAATETDSF